MTITIEDLKFIDLEINKKVTELCLNVEKCTAGNKNNCKNISVLLVDICELNKLKNNIVSTISFNKKIQTIKINY